jgi:hypothetical protein
MSVGFNLSLSDLLLCEGFAQAFGEDNKEQINKFLFDNGLDVEMGIDEVVCKHRNLRGNVVDCLMYQGHERSCKEWLTGGSASWDNTLEHSGLDLRIQLKTMGKMLNTGDFCEYAEKHGIQSDSN